MASPGRRASSLGLEYMTRYLGDPQKRLSFKKFTPARGVGYAVTGFCVGLTWGSLIGYPAAVSGKSMQPIFNYPTRTRTGWQFSCLPTPNEPFSENNFCEEEHEDWDDGDVGEGLIVALWTQDWVWVNTFAARNYKFTPGDIVVYVSPKDSTDCLIKRVIGVEGDIISSDRYKVPHLLVPDGHLWLEGDNWGNSVDSNKYGPVSKGLVFGIATAVIWPPGRPERVVHINKVIKRGRESEGEGLAFYWRVLKNFLKLS